MIAVKEEFSVANSTLDPYEWLLASIQAAGAPVTIEIPDDDDEEKRVFLTVQPLNVTPPPPPKNRPQPKLKMDGSARKVRETIFGRPHVCENCKFPFLNISQFSGHRSKCTPEKPWNGCPSRDRSRQLPGAISAGPHQRKKAAHAVKSEQPRARPKRPRAASVEGGTGSAAKPKRRPAKRPRVSSAKSDLPLQAPLLPYTEPDKEEMSFVSDFSIDPELEAAIARIPDDAPPMPGHRYDEPVPQATEAHPPGDLVMDLLSISHTDYIRQLHEQYAACTSLDTLMRFDTDLCNRMKAILAVRSNIIKAMNAALSTNNTNTQYASADSDRNVHGTLHMTPGPPSYADTESMMHGGAASVNDFFAPF